MLEDSLNKFTKQTGASWDLNPGDGAFYGPKIDIVISDALRRKHQCATIQLDFQLPQRFNLEYRTESAGGGEDHMARPVIIHRAILGSVERMMGILIEHFAGKFPFWLSPRQIQIIPVAAAFFDYAKEITNKLVSLGLFADADLSDNTLNKKIRNAELAQYNFIFVVGGEEESTRSVNVRNRDDVGTKAKGKTVPLEEIYASAKNLKESRSLDNKL
jgi:threonyl-tRNA synthetase